MSRSSVKSESFAAAQQYAARGWAVLPLHSADPGCCSCGEAGCESPGKHPRTVHGVKDATTDERTVREWWVRWPQANVGIATGRASGLVVLDVDRARGGQASLELLRAECPDLQKAPTVETGGGGIHLYFAHADGHIPNKVDFLPGLDIRGDGGYVVAPPSRHKSGRTYQWR